jgi:hypothetical protein
MGSACSTHGYEEECMEDIWWESQKERDHYEDIDAGGKRILKWFLDKYDWVLWTGVIWLRIGTSGELL